LNFEKLGLGFGEKRLEKVWPFLDNLNLEELGLGFGGKRLENNKNIGACLVP
jgi:hypothetical protein